MMDDTKVWNEDLVAGLEARAQMIMMTQTVTLEGSVQPKRQRGINKRKIYSMYKKGLSIVQATRPDIYIDKNNCVINLPTNKLEHDINELCQNIMFGREPIFPTGYKLYDPLRSISNVVIQNKQQKDKSDIENSYRTMSLNQSPTQTRLVLQENRVSTSTGDVEVNDGTTIPYWNDIYLNRIKKRGGAYAILVAFYINKTIGNAIVLTKGQLCHIAQYHCDEEMTTNYSAGRVHSGWTSIKTLQKHNLVTLQRHGNKPSTYTLTDHGLLFVQALIEKNPSLRYDINDWIQNHSSQHLCTAIGDSDNPTRENHLVSSTHENKVTSADRSHNISNPYISNGIVNPYAKKKSEHSLNINNKHIDLDVSKVEHPEINPSKNSKVHSNDDRGTTQQQEYDLHQSSWNVLESQSDASLSENEIQTSNKRNNKSDNQPRQLSREDGGRCPFPLQNNNSDSDDSSLSDLDLPLCRIARNRNSDNPDWRHKGSGMLDDIALDSSDENCARSDSQSTTDLIRSIRRLSIINPVLAKPDPHIAASTCTCTNFCNKTDSTCNEFLIRHRSELEKNSGHNCVIKCQPASYPTSINTLTRYNDDEDKVDDGVPYKDHSSPNSSIEDTGDNDTDEDGDEDNILGFQPFCLNSKKKENAKNQYIENQSKCEEQLIIYIDDRERNRNITPRMLRIELTRTLQSRFLRKYWPKQIQEAIVKEKRLRSGDFSFELINKNGKVYQLPVLVERKRIGDIVQRSHDKDHWYQLQRMESVIKSIDSINGTCFFLLEGDATKAVQYSQLQSQSTSDHTICDDESLYRFIVRAIIRFGIVRFIQAKDEQSSFRAIGSLSLMMINSKKLVAKDKEQSQQPDWKKDRTFLIHRLEENYISFQVATSVADEIGSIEKLKDLYKTISDDECRLQVLEPIFNNIPNQHGSNSALEWSARVSEVFGHNRYVSHFETPSSRRRHVEVGLPYKFQSILRHNQQSDIASFYTETVSQTHTKIPTIQIHTTNGRYKSSTMMVSIIDGQDILCYAKVELIAQNDCAKAAVVASKKISDELPKSEQYPNILLIRGMSTSIDHEARKNGFRPELRILADMIQAELMLYHNTIVLHPQRLDGDLERIVYQIVYSCYEFQLLTKPC